MSGISSKSVKCLENRKKFVSQEFADDLGLNLYQFRFRNHDPQIGRFIQIDPIADHYVYNSTYAYAENDVIRAIDVEGLEKLITINKSVNHHAPNNNTIILNRDKALQRSVSSGENEKRVLSYGQDNAQKFVSALKETDPVPNGYKSVSETVSTSLSVIEDVEFVGKVLKTTTETVTTTVKFQTTDDIENGISEITQISGIKVSYTKIVGEDVKNNSITVSLNPSDSYTVQGTAPTIVNFDINNKRLSEKLSMLSKTLESRTIGALQTNKELMESGKKALESLQKTEW